jgi:hypothetical protein
MSDIPELAREFMRIRRDDLLILHFLDILNSTLNRYNVNRGSYENMNDIGLEDAMILIKD